MSVLQVVVECVVSSAALIERVVSTADPGGVCCSLWAVCSPAAPAGCEVSEVPQQPDTPRPHHQVPAAPAQEEETSQYQCAVPGTHTHTHMMAHTLRVMSFPLFLRGQPSHGRGASPPLPGRAQAQPFSFIVVGGQSSLCDSGTPKAPFM